MASNATTDVGHQHDDYIGSAFVLFFMLLISQPALLAVLAISLLKYKRATKALIQSRTRFHERAVLIHENYLTLPNFVNNVDEWKKRYEKAKKDFEYTLSILAPDDSSPQNTASARQRVGVALKWQAERRFADLKRRHNFCPDEWSAWLTKFLEENPKEEAVQMEHRLVELGKMRGVGLDSRQKRRIRDEKKLLQMRHRTRREGKRNKKRKKNNTATTSKTSDGKAPAPKNAAAAAEKAAGTSQAPMPVG